MATEKRCSSAEEEFLSETPAPQRLYLIVAVMHILPDSYTQRMLRDCVVTLNKAGDDLLADFLESKYLKSLGTHGVKLGVFSTLKNAEIAAENMKETLNKYIRDKFCCVDDFHEFYILRFHANVPCAELTWNGTEMKQGRMTHGCIYPAITIEWTNSPDYKADEESYEPKKKKFFVSQAKLLFCRIPYRDNQERMMELGLYDDEEAFQRDAKRIQPQLPKDHKLGFLDVRVDDLEWSCGVEHQYGGQLMEAHWL